MWGAQAMRLWWRLGGAGECTAWCVVRLTVVVADGVATALMNGMCFRNCDGGWLAHLRVLHASPTNQTNITEAACCLKQLSFCVNTKFSQWSQGVCTRGWI